MHVQDHRKRGRVVWQTSGVARTPKLCSSMAKGRSGWFHTEKPAASPLIYKMPINLQKSKHDVGRTRFSSVSRRWVDPGLTLHYMLQFRSNVEPMLAQSCVHFIRFGLA